MANFDIVVIGASAGGVGSLQRVVEHIQRYSSARELDAQAQQVRNLVLAGVGAAEEESSSEEPTPEEP